MDDADDKKTELDSSTYSRAIVLTGGVVFWISLILVNIAKCSFDKYMNYKVMNVTNDLVPQQIDGEDGAINVEDIQTKFLTFFGMNFFGMCVHIG